MKQLLNITSLFALTICCIFTESLVAHQVIFINYSDKPIEVCKITNIAHPRRMPENANYLVSINGQPYGNLYPNNIQGWRLCNNQPQNLKPYEMIIAQIQPNFDQPDQAIIVPELIVPYKQPIAMENVLTILRILEKKNYGLDKDTRPLMVDVATMNSFLFISAAQKN